MVEKSQIDPKSRPFQLSIHEMGALCWAYKEIIDKTPGLFKYTHLSKNDDWLTKEKDSEDELLRWKSTIGRNEFY